MCSHCHSQCVWSAFLHSDSQGNRFHRQTTYMYHKHPFGATQSHRSPFKRLCIRRNCTKSGWNSIQSPGRGYKLETTLSLDRVILVFYVGMAALKQQRTCNDYMYAYRLKYTCTCTMYIKISAFSHNTSDMGAESKFSGQGRAIGVKILILTL